MLLSIYSSPGVLHAAPPSVGGEGVVGLVGEGGAVPAVQYSTVQYSTVQYRVAQYWSSRRMSQGMSRSNSELKWTCSRPSAGYRAHNQ